MNSPIRGVRKRNEKGYPHRIRGINGDKRIWCTLCAARCFTRHDLAEKHTEKHLPSRDGEPRSPRSMSRIQTVIQGRATEEIRLKKVLGEIGLYEVNAGDHNEHHAWEDMDPLEGGDNMLECPAVDPEAKQGEVGMIIESAEKLRNMIRDKGIRITTNTNEIDRHIVMVHNRYGIDVEDRKDVRSAYRIGGEYYSREYINFILRMSVMQLQTRQISRLLLLESGHTPQRMKIDAILRACFSDDAFLPLREVVTRWAAWRCISLDGTYKITKPIRKLRSRAEIHEEEDGGNDEENEEDEAEEDGDTDEESEGDDAADPHSVASEDAQVAVTLVVEVGIVGIKLTDREDNFIDLVLDKKPGGRFIIA